MESVVWGRGGRALTRSLGPCGSWARRQRLHEARGRHVVPSSRAGAPPLELMAPHLPTMVSGRVMVGGPFVAQGPSSANLMCTPT